MLYLIEYIERMTINNLKTSADSIQYIRRMPSENNSSLPYFYSNISSSVTSDLTDRVHNAIFNIIIFLKHVKVKEEDTFLLYFDNVISDLINS